MPEVCCNGRLFETSKQVIGISHHLQSDDDYFFSQRLEEDVIYTVPW